MKYDGVIFDLDGTLWDSCSGVAESWNRSLEKHFGQAGQFTPEDVRGIMGLTFREIAETLFIQYGRKAEDVCAMCLKDEPDYLAKGGAQVYDGVGDMLRRMSKETGLFIVSNCQSGYIESFLSFSGLGEYISDIACEGDTGLSKAENIRLICRRNDIHRPVYVGDTVFDQRSAAEAGSAFIHAAYGFGRAEPPAVSIGAPAELPELLEKM